MNSEQKNDEIRWQIITTMLDEFPSLKVRLRRYLKNQPKH